MKKLKLDLDNLRVDSFDLTPAKDSGGRGTVVAQYDTCDTCTCYSACGTCPTCCGTCYYTDCGTCPQDWSCCATCNSCDSCNDTCGDSCGCTDPKICWD
jgi:hypothetical protein